MSFKFQIFPRMAHRKRDFICVGSLHVGTYLLSFVGGMMCYGDKRREVFTREMIR